MIQNNFELEGLRILIEENFKVLGKKISQNDESIRRLLEKIEQENIDYTKPLDLNDIKIVSYLDN